MAMDSRKSITCGASECRTALSAETEKNRYEERKRKGLCVTCSAKALDNYIYCENCLIKNKGFDNIDDYNKYIGKRKPLVERILQDYLKDIIMDKSLVFNSRKILGSRLELDIYSKDKKIAIEVDGAFHHTSVKVGKKFSNLEKQKERDRKKENLCEKNGINLYRLNIFEYDIESISKKVKYIVDVNYPEIKYLVSFKEYFLDRNKKHYIYFGSEKSKKSATMCLFTIGS